ncbi:MAG: 16S rRNA (uracil(1498)-N(3))-methyltransferase [Bacteroidales bacterium]|nr:16S rRNA (uracil(1498)-N(3))-methyltransferase [Bacteroidales bacterium]
MIQFYCPDIKSNPVLPESDSQHCVRVLRMSEGDALEVVDGRGMRYVCRLLEAHPKRAMVEIIEAKEQPLHWRNEITLAVAPTKLNDRMEWLVEKLVEIGINRIVPVRCAHSERKEIKRERLEKIAISAMKQSLKATLPRIDEMMPLTEFLKTVDSEQRFMGYCSDEFERRLLARTAKPGLSTAILIGPEGDFSHEEVASAISSGFTPVTLGDNRLRTETAALVAVTTIHILNQMSFPKLG